MVGYFCCVPNCKKTSKDIAVHRFPKETALWKQWLELIQRPDLMTAVLLTNYRVCDVHFGPESRIPTNYRSRSGLIYGALPSLHLPINVDIPPMEAEFLQPVVGPTSISRNVSKSPEPVARSSDKREKLTTLVKKYPEENKRKVVPPTIPEIKIEASKPEPPIEINEPVIEETTVRSVQILTEDGPCELCRICLKPAKDSLVNQGTIEKELTTILPAFNFDLYPDPKVCLDCVTILNQTVAFHDRILESDTFIGKYLSTTLPNAGPLDIIIVPPDLKEEDAVQILQKCDDSPREEVSTNDSTPPAIISEPIKRSPEREHCYARPPKLQSRAIHVCTVCVKQFSSRTNLNTHTRKKHETYVNLNKRKICPLCKSEVTTFEELDKHLMNHHNISLQHTKEHFSSSDEFLKWKQTFQQDTKSSYILTSSVSRKKAKTTYYVCHRSGFYQTCTNKRQRALKLKGSNKINAHCPARIKVQTDAKNHVTVECVSSHIGHDLDVGKVRLTKSQLQQ